MTAFVPLTPALEAREPVAEPPGPDFYWVREAPNKVWFERMLEDMSASLRRRVWAAFILISWDALSPDDRRTRALLWDWEHDPANNLEQEAAPLDLALLWDRETDSASQLEQNRAWDLGARRGDIELAITKWQKMPIQNASEADLQEKRLDELSQELAGVEAQIRELDKQSEGATGKGGTASLIESELRPAGASSQAADDDARRSSDDVSTLQAQPRSLIAAKNTQIRKAGRPPVIDTVIRLFNERRAAGVPFPPTRLQEAEAIVTAWPIGGLRKPKANTVSQLLSDVWQQER